jgi:hypothetical protein
MSAQLPSLAAIVDLIADRIAARLEAPHVAERVPLADVAAHGAPSSRWVQDRARRGEMRIHGPRGGRYVLRADLDALLASTTIARRERAPVVGPPELASIEDDARAAVVNLVSSRKARRVAR